MPGQYPYGPPGNPRRKRRTLPVVVAIVVALVAAAGGYFVFFAGGGDGPDTPAAKDYNAAVEELGAAEVAWQTVQGEAPEAIVAGDHWVTDTHLVRRLPGRVVSYDLKTGDEAWTFALEGPTEDRCRSSQEHSNNRVALLRDVDESDDNVCGRLTVLDLAAGTEVFTADLPAGEDVPNHAAVPVVVGERVVVDSVHMFDLGSGAPVSTPAAFAACEVRSLGLFGDLLLADSTCVGNTEDTNGWNDRIFRLRAFDANFSLLWEWDTPSVPNEEPLPVLGVLSVDPLVIEVGWLGHTPQLMRLDPATGATVPISAYLPNKEDGHMGACDGSSLGACDQARVADNKVILMTTQEQINPSDPDASPGQGSTEFRNELVAYDLDTGEEAWRSGKVDGRILGLVPTAADTIVAYQPANPNGTKGLVVTVDPATGKVAPLMAIGPNAHDDRKLIDHLIEYHFGGDSNQAVWRDGLFIVFSNTHRTATQGEPDTVAFALPK
jgi:outer membrane protein assembly factor BamB